MKKNINPVVYSTVMSELQLHDKSLDYRKHLHLIYGILLHITNLIKRNKGTTPVSINVITDTAISQQLMPEEFHMVCRILKSLSRIYNITFQAQEIDFIASYFSILNQWSKHISPGILVICHGESTASDMVNFVRNIVPGDYTIESINFTTEMTLDDCMEIALQKINNFTQISGVLLLCDIQPLTFISDFLQSKTDLPIRMLAPISLSLLIDCVTKATQNTLDLNNLQTDSIIDRTKCGDVSNKFLHNLSEKVLKQNCIFLDVEKAVNILDHCLKSTLRDLNIIYSDEIAAKYLCHCCNMLERVIKKDFWNYSNLNTFVNTNSKMLHIIEQNLEYAETSYGINIPSSELAYITEIFLQ